MSWIWQAQGGGSSGGGMSVRLPALQSEIVPAVAMWALRTAPTLSIATDRSGNGYDLTPVPNSYNAPDLISGFTCFTPWKTPVAVPPVGLYPQGIQRTTITPALQITGDVSVTLRMYVPTYPNAAGAPLNQYVVSCAEFNDATAAGNCLYSIVLNNVNQNILYFSQSGAKVAQIYQTTLNASDGLWHFVSLRRNATTRVVTIGLDGTYQSSGALTNPTNGTNAALYIGRPPVSGGGTSAGNMGLLGGIADVCVWPVELTTAQVESLRREAMGV
jgi:hypothetical protein